MSDSGPREGSADLVTTLPSPDPGPAQPRPPSEEETLLGDGEVAVLRAPDPSPDPESIGRYEVIERIGEGGMGLIFIARDPELERKVAVKLVRPALHERGRDARQRLLREAQALAKINHPNVIHVYEVGTYEDQVYVAMEFVDGKTLRDWQWQPHVSWRRILDAYVAAARGLAAAHEREMVHRDFKPDNVLVSTDGKVRVIDFGLARARGAIEERIDGPTDGVELVEAATIDIARPLTRLTKTGAILGTPAYMAPEQHRGDPADARTDQFSFCVALYEALYGMRPFGGSTYPVLVSNVLDGRVEEEPRFVEVPQTIRRALLKGLSVDPKKRFADMNALIQELRRDPNATQRRWRLAALGAVALVVAAGAWSSIQDSDRIEAEGRRLRSAAATDRIQHLEGRLEEGTRERNSYNEFLLARATGLLEHNPSKVLGTLAWMSDPTPQQIASARLLAARAVTGGIGKHIEVEGAYRERLAVSADGERYVLAGDDGVSLHLPGGVRVTSETETTVHDVAIALDEAIAVAGLADGSVLRLSGEGAELIELSDRAITAIAISPDAKEIAAGAEDGTIFTFGVAAGRAEIHRQFSKHTEAVRGLAFDPEGKLLASGADDGKLIRWRVAEMKFKDIEPGAVGITQVAWSEDEHIWALGSNGDLISWDPQGKTPDTITTHVQTFALVGNDALAVDAEGEIVRAPPPFRELRLARPVSALAVDRNRGLMTLDEQHGLRRWTVKSTEPVALSKSSARARFLRLSADGRIVLAATSSDGIEVHDLQTRQRLLTLETLDEPILELDLAPDASAFAVMTQSGTLHLVSIDGKRHRTLASAQLLTGAALAWAPDSKSVATVSCHEQCGLLIYRQDGSLRAHADVGVNLYGARLAFGPESRWIYTDLLADAPTVVDANDGNVVQLEWAGQMPPTRLTQRWSSAQGLVVAGLDAEERLQIWQRGSETGTMHAVHEQAVARALPIPGRRDLFVREQNGAATLWHLDRLADPITLPSLPPATEVILSPDATWLLLHPENQTDHHPTLVHLDSGATLELGAIPLGAVVTRDGAVVGLDGAELGITAPPVPVDWEVLVTWFDAVGDGRVDPNELVGR